MIKTFTMFTKKQSKEISKTELSNNDKRVEIINDTVNHRIPIGKIVKIKSLSDKTINGKKCYNILDYCCYVTEDDIQVVDDIQFDIQVDDKKIEKKIDTSKIISESSYKKGDKIYLWNVYGLTPNGTTFKVDDGYYILYDKNINGSWYRSLNENDLNEYWT